jgi:hypothetical protein
MSIGMTAVLQRNRLDEITALIDSTSPPAGLIRIYSNGRPANADTAVTVPSPLPVLLAELTFSATSFPAASGTPGSMTANAISPDTSADNTGTATWFRVTDAAGNAVFDGYAGVSGSSPDPDLVLNSAAINSGVQVSISSFVLTAGNQ